jgi:hypothetical protein
MHALSKLYLEDMAQLESLSFLSSESLARRVPSLTLKSCRRLTASQLIHVLALPQLTALKLHDCFSERLGSFTLGLLNAPSRQLPKLRSSVIECAPPAPPANPLI